MIAAYQTEHGAVLAKSGRQRILVVDDEELVRWSIMKVLQRGNYDVATASSAEEAREKIGTSNFDLVITDKKLPGADGFALAQLVKKNSPDCPVVMITAYGDEDSRTHAKEIGIDYFLDKSTDLAEILWIATRILRQQ